MSKRKKICLDPGHGGRDSGAVGPTGYRESDHVLKVGRSLQAGLEDAGAEVLMTRKTDLFVPLQERANLANRWGADVFLSLHANAGGGYGFEAFTSPGETASDPIATQLLKRYHLDFPSRTFRKDMRDGDPDKEARFTVLTATSMPAVLFELGFIDHDREESWLRSTWPEQALSLAGGLAQVLGLPETPAADPVPADSPGTRETILRRVEAAEWQLQQIRSILI